MGGTISKLGGNSVVSGHAAPSVRKDGKSAARERPEPEHAGDGLPLGKRNVSRPRQPGEIAPGFQQVRSNLRKEGFKDNVALLRTHAAKLSPAELQDVARELAQSLPEPDGIRLLAEHLGESGTSFTPEQLKSFGRGMALAGERLWLQQTPTADSGVFAPGIPDFANPSDPGEVRNVECLTAGALTLFQGRSDERGDRLSQQIGSIVRAREDSEYDARFRPMGALVLERGLDKIDVESYERICKAAALNLYHTRNADAGWFSRFIPGADSTRPEIAQCHAKWSEESLSRSNKPGQPFQPEGRMDQAGPGTPKRVFSSPENKSARQPTSQRSAGAVHVQVRGRPAAPAVPDPTPADLASALASDPDLLAQARALVEKRKADAKR